jgi:putative ABC transport system ATP-binding protein
MMAMWPLQRFASGISERRPANRQETTMRPDFLPEATVTLRKRGNIHVVATHRISDHGAHDRLLRSIIDFSKLKLSAEKGGTQVSPSGPRDGRQLDSEMDLHPPVVKMSSAFKSFRQGGVLQDVLSDVDFTLPSGRLSAIMGVSGAGKSTLLNIIGGLDSLDRGTISVCGHELQDMSLQALTEFRSRYVGFVFQFHNLLPSLTAYENVLLGIEAQGKLDQEKRARAMGYLAEMGLEGKEHKFPNQLSGGEQQRVSIARALAKEPELLLADEPTGNLDEENGRRVLEILRRVQRDRRISVCLVTHNPDLAA